MIAFLSVFQAGRVERSGANRSPRCKLRGNPHYTRRFGSNRKPFHLFGYNQTGGNKPTASGTVEERLAALEAEVEQLKAQQSSATTPPLPNVIGQTRPDFLERFGGMYANNPLVQSVLDEFLAERERERERARRGEDDSEISEDT